MSTALINKLLEVTGCKNDAALCAVLGIQAPTISKIRSQVLYPGSTLLLNMHEESGISIKELKELRGLRKK